MEKILTQYKAKCGAFTLSHQIEKVKLGADTFQIKRTYISTSRFIAKTLFTDQKEYLRYPGDLQQLFKVTFDDANVVK